MNVAELVDRHEAAWTRATEHRFLSAVRDGALPRTAFDTWLAQDHIFASDLLWFQARLLARAPRPAQPVLAAGLVALVDELAWFEQRAEERNIALETSPLPAAVAYRDLLDRFDRADFPVALTMLWALERAYLDAWSFARPGAAAYQDFIAHWTTPKFAEYVAALQEAADAVLVDGTDVDALFVEVVDAEGRFWDMAWERAT